MARGYLIFAIICGLSHIEGLSATTRYHIPNPCGAETGCAGCVSVDPTCAWCPHFRHRGPRCVQGDYLVPPPKDGCNSSWVFPYPEVYLKDLRIENALNMMNRKRAKFVIRPGVAVMIEILVKVQKKHRLMGKVYSVLRTPAGLETSISSNCKGFQTTSRKSWCLVPRPIKHVGFNVTIVATRCLLNTARIRFVSAFSPRSVAKININSPCSCACEKRPIKRSDRCNSRGDEVCGQCHCERGSFGDRCQCDGEDEGDRSCTSPGSLHVCSNRGSCKCGVCECSKIPGSVVGYRYAGRYCECDDLSCPVWKQKLCGGSERGSCKCGRCVCMSRYRGSACEREGEPCTSRSGYVCSNRGRCLNKTCQCTMPYIGEYCHQISMNKSAVCDLLKDCVLMVFGSGPLTIYEYETRCKRHQFNIVERILESPGADNVCGFLDPADGLSFVFTFEKFADRPLRYFVAVRNWKG